MTSTTPAFEGKKRRIEWRTTQNNLRVRADVLAKEVETAVSRVPPLTIEGQQDASMDGLSFHHMRNAWLMDAVADENDERAYLKESLQTIKDAVLVVGNNVALARSQPRDTTIEQLKQRLDRAEKLINSVKTYQQQQMMDLLLLSRKLDHEVNAWNDRVLEMERDIDSNSNYFHTNGISCKNVLKMDKNSIGQKMDDVVAFEKFVVANGGQYGGWTMENHQIFLRISQKHKVKTRLIQLVADQTGLPVDQVEAHFTWFKTYLDLNEKRKLAIARWRNQKKEMIQSSISEQGLAEEESQKAAAPKKKLSEEELKHLEEMKRKKEQVQKWKDEKQRAEAKRAMELEARERKSREKERQALIERQLANKVALEKHREQKEFENEHTPIIIKAPEKIDSAKLKKFREKDKEFLDRRLSALSRVQTPVIEKEQRLEKLRESVAQELKLESVTANWDRIMTPSLSADRVENIKKTEEQAAALKHQRQFFEPGRGAIGTRALPKRATPPWRSGVLSK